MTTEEEFAAKGPLHAALLDAEKRVVDLGEENARLRAERDAALVHGPEDLIRALEESNAEVKRLEGLILDWYSSEEERPLLDEAKRIRGEK